MYESKSQDNLGAISQKALPHALADRLKRCPAVSLLGYMVAHDLCGALINGCKEPTPPLLLRVKAHPISAPEVIRSLSASGVTVDPASALIYPPHRGKESVLPHKTKDAVSAEPNPLRRNIVQTFRCPSERYEHESSTVLTSSRSESHRVLSETWLLEWRQC